jgi:hypothetical protein
MILAVKWALPKNFYTSCIQKFFSLGSHCNCNNFTV